MENNNVNSAILERVERVVEALQDNSVKMGELLAVHNEKLDKQDRIDAVLFEKIESLHKDLDRSTDEIKKGCERDIRLVDQRLRVMEKKMWSIAGALTIISFVVSPMGQRFLRGVLTPVQESVTINLVQSPMSELS
tara:strand:+ start:1805 stop:2212 length:408 start_codon:yes stop_codon:yes gene_type:complete